jgi:hypothetical protein
VRRRRPPGHPASPVTDVRDGFLASHFGVAFFALAAIVLAVTGAEARYADIGHFGRRAITRGRLILVFPACVLSYLGQGALILDDPRTSAAPFSLLAPGWAPSRCDRQPRDLPPGGFDALLTPLGGNSPRRDATIGR